VTDRRTDGRTDGQTDNGAKNNMSPHFMGEDINISTKITLGNILFGCLRQVCCLIEVTANTGLTVFIPCTTLTQVWKKINMADSRSFQMKIVLHVHTTFYRAQTFFITHQLIETNTIIIHEQMRDVNIKTIWLKFVFQSCIIYWYKT